jgi:RNA polymerase sigma-B factor
MSHTTPARFDGELSGGVPDVAPDGAPAPWRRDERDLLRRYRLGGDRAAREALVERFLPFARQLARRYRRSAETVEDLEQVAGLALVKAIDRFDVSRGTAFSSFLVPTVLGELKRHFRDAAWAAHVPRRMQERVMRVTTAVEDLSSGNGRSPSVAEIADHTAQSSEDVLEAMEASQAFHARPIEPPAPDDEPGVDHESALGRRDAGFDLAELGAAVKPVVRRMPPRVREILRLRFVEDLTQSEIAQRVGVSQMHVSRLIRGAVQELRRASDEDAVDVRGA